MASSSGKDQDDHVHGQRDPQGQESSAAAATSTVAPAAAAAERRSEAFPPPRPPAPPVLSLDRERAREQPGDGGRGSYGSSSAAVEVDRKGKGKLIEESSPTHARLLSEEDAEESISHLLSEEDAEESSAAAAAATSTVAPATAAAERRSDASPPPPPRAPPVLSLDRGRARQQPGDGGRGSYGSSSAAAAVDRKGKGKLDEGSSWTPPSTSRSRVHVPVHGRRRPGIYISGSSASATAAAAAATGAVPGRQNRLYTIAESPDCSSDDSPPPPPRPPVDSRSQERPREQQAALRLHYYESLWSFSLTHIKNKIFRKGRRTEPSNTVKNPQSVNRKRKIKVSELPPFTLRPDDDAEDIEQLDTTGNPSTSISPPHVDRETIPARNAVAHYFRNMDESVEHAVFTLNVVGLDHHYVELRPVYRDGESFYRSFIFSYLEQVVGMEGTYEEERLLRVIGELTRRPECRLRRWAAEFSRSREAFEELMNKVMRWKGVSNFPESNSVDKGALLLEFFSSYDNTIDIFAFLRLVTSIFICANKRVYRRQVARFAGANVILEDWCSTQIVPLGVPLPQAGGEVAVHAMGAAFKVAMRVQKMEPGGYYNVYHRVRGVPYVCLLFTGSHYDILYPDEEDAPTWRAIISDPPTPTPTPPPSQRASASSSPQPQGGDGAGSSSSGRRRRDRDEGASWFHCCLGFTEQDD